MKIVLAIPCFFQMKFHIGGFLFVEYKKAKHLRVKIRLAIFCFFMNGSVHFNVVIGRSLRWECFDSIFCYYSRFLIRGLIKVMIHWAFTILYNLLVLWNVFDVYFK